MTNGDHSVQLFDIHNVQDVSTNQIWFVLFWVRGFGSISKPQHVWDKKTKAVTTKKHNLIPPDEGGCREPVKKKQSWQGSIMSRGVVVVVVQTPRGC